MRIRLLPAAEGDLEIGADFYEAQKAGLGAYFNDCLASDIESLKLYAGIHSILLDPDNDKFRNARMAHYLSTGDLDAALVDLEHLERLQSGYAESMREHFEQAKVGG